MDEKQPEALRLADLCRSGALINDEWDQVANELIRLHALVEGLQVAGGKCDECGKPQVEGWALYCVGCLQKTGLLANQAPSKDEASPGIICLPTQSEDEVKTQLRGAQVEILDILKARGLVGAFTLVGACREGCIHLSGLRTAPEWGLLNLLGRLGRLDRSEPGAVEELTHVIATHLQLMEGAPEDDAQLYLELTTGVLETLLQGMADNAQMIGTMASLLNELIESHDENITELAQELLRKAGGQMGTP